MTDVSVIGTGAMGSAITRALLSAGNSVTIWNRTAEKMTPLRALGAHEAASIIDAVKASPVILVSVTNYSVTNALLGTKGVTRQLTGRTLVQLSTGSPSEVRESEAWASSCGAGYVDAVVMAFATSVGKASTPIFVSGSEKAFDRGRRYLACIGGDIRYLGSNIVAAAAIDLAQHCYYAGVMIGLAHGVLLCERENVSPDVLASTFDKGSLAERTCSAIGNRAFGNSDSSIALWAGALEHLATQARDTGMNSEFADFVAGIFRRAMAAGMGKNDTAALIEVLRGKSSASV
jgi:3-hydroxyisobutyrate dehydrogenase-like beta-hydroxyacid dehydrogenase